MANQIEYRRHIIMSMPSTKVEGQWDAQAFRRKRVDGKLKKERVGTIRSGGTEEAAILAVKAELDAIRIEQVRRRGPDGYPTSVEIRAAFEAISMTVNQKRMLDAHVAASQHTLTATQLARAGEYDSYVSANSQYGTLGRKLAEELEW